MANIAITFGSDAAASASATTITRTATYAAGETIAVLAHWASTTITATVSDGTHTFTPQTVVSGSTVARRQQWFTAKNVAGGSFTITVTFSLTVANRHVAYFRTANPDTTANPQDAKGRDQLNPGTGANACTTTNMTPTSQPAGVLATCTTYVGASTVTAGTGFTSLGVLTAYNALNADTSLTEFQRITATSALAGTFTIGSATETTFAMGLILTEAATVADTNFGFRVRVPNNRVGPMALRQLYRSPAYPFDSTVIPGTITNRLRRFICAGA